MIPTLRDFERIVFDAIDEPVFIINPARPPACPILLQWFWFPQSGERISRTVFDQCIEFGQDLGIGLLPVEIVVPGGRGEDNPHSLSFRSWPPPAFSSSIDSWSRAAFAGLRNRCMVSSWEA